MTKYTVLLDIVTVSESVGAFLSMLTSAVMLTLLCTYKQAKLGNYKYLMISCCFIQMLYSITSFSSHMRAHSTNSSFVLFREYRGSDRQFAPVLILQFCWVYATEVAILSLHFLYRYISIWHTSKMHWFDEQRLYLWIGLAFLFGFIVAFLKYMFFSENPYLSEHLSHDFTEFYNLQMDEIVYIGPVYYKEPYNEKPMDVWITIAVLILGMLVCYSSMLLLGLLTYMKLQNRKSLLSEKTRDLQQQLFIALIVQAFIPSVLILIPSEFLFCSPMLGIGLGPYANIAIIFLTIYPPFDQLGVIYIIKDFRMTLKAVLRKITSTQVGSTG